MIQARRYLIAGRVQGVGFRFFVREAASLEALHGVARNLPDGRVEVVVEGEADGIVRFERTLRRGPAGARVEEVTTELITPSGRLVGFQIH